MDMAVIKRKDLEASELSGGDPSVFEESDLKKAEDGSAGREVEDAKRSTPLSQIATSIETGIYTDQELEILAASLHASPAGSISATPTAATAHDRRMFITLVRPPPNNPTPEPSDSSSNREFSSTAQPTLEVPMHSVLLPSTRPQSPSTTTTMTQRPSPSRSGMPARNGEQVLFPTIVTPAPTPTKSAERTTSSITSSIETPPPLSPSSAVSSALVAPSQRPEKQPDAVATPVTSPKGLNRAAEAGIVIGSIALVSLVLGAALLYYYKRKPSANNIFTSRNKNLVPQRSISRPVPQDMSPVAASNQAPRAAPPARAQQQQQQPAPAMAERPPVYPRPERPLPPVPVRRSLMNRSSSMYSRLP